MTLHLMAAMMKTISFLRHIFMPRFLSKAAPTTPSPFSTNSITPLHSPLADFAASTFNLSPADIAGMLKKVPSLDNPKTLQNVERVVHLLTKSGCTQRHISRIMRSQPRIMAVNAEKVLEPKIELFKDLGIDEKHLPILLFRVPTVLAVSLQDGLLPKITFLKSIFQSQNLVIKAVKGDPYILNLSLEKKLRPSLAFWEGFGFQREELTRFLSTKPSLLRCSYLMAPKVDLIRNIGISKDSKAYKDVLSVVALSRMETLEFKMDYFRQWGLSTEEIWELFRRSPRVFGYSQNTLREKMEFVVRTIELPPNTVVKHSAFLRCSFERVLKPRFAVFQHIKSLNGVEHLKSKPLSTVIYMQEARFVNKILKGHPELETLYALHRKPIPNV